VVPEQAATPIFEQVVTSWFVEPAAKPLGRRNGSAAPVEWPAVGAGEAGAAAGSGSGPESAGGSRADASAAHRTFPAEAADSPARAGTVSRSETTSAALPAADYAVSSPDWPTPDWPTAVEEPVEEPAARAETAVVGEWDTPADRTRQAAESALRPAVAQRLTGAGLPTRRPGAQLAPGAVVSRGRAQAGGTFRDAAAVRSSLARHYQGMRAARQETAARAEESGTDEGDPR
jgi:hypothetical protein